MLHDPVLTDARIEYDAAREELTKLIVRAERGGDHTALEAATERMRKARAAQDRAAIDLVSRIK